MFRASTVPIIRSYQLYTWQVVCFMQVMWPLPRRVRLGCTRGNWRVSCRLCGRCLGESGWAVHVAIGMFHAGYLAATWESQVVPT
jgi:hypothetical protein